MKRLFLALMVFLISVQGVAAMDMAPVTRDLAEQQVPVVVRSTSGVIVIAWEQLTLLNGVRERDIFVTTSTDGVTFSSPFNISRNPGPSRTPSLLALRNGDVVLFYADQINGSFRIMQSIYTAGWWTLPVRISAPSSPSAIDPIGVESTTGKVWIAWRGTPGGTLTDIWARISGGPDLNLSKFGSAVRRPPLAAGDNGEVYTAWADHANELPGASLGINVRHWNGTQWVKLPNASPVGFTGYVGLGYTAGQLYCVWPKDGTRIYRRAWNGTAWGQASPVATGKYITFVRFQISPSGNQYLSWEDNGTVYLKKNSLPPIVVAQGMHEPALYVDATDTVYMVFRNNDVWFTQIP